MFRKPTQYKYTILATLFRYLSLLLFSWPRVGDSGQIPMDKIIELYGRPNNLLFTEETILGYQRGGYHPVALGDTLKDGRYKICHKLGHGGYSTVWVARDSMYVVPSAIYDPSMLTIYRIER